MGLFILDLGSLGHWVIFYKTNVGVFLEASVIKRYNLSYFSKIFSYNL